MTSGYDRPPKRSPGAGRSCTTSRRKRYCAAGRPPVAARLLDQSCFVKQLVAVEHLFLVPGRAADGETMPHPLAPAERSRWLVLAGLRPMLQQRHDGLVEDAGPPVAPILPGKEAV